MVTGAPRIRANAWRVLEPPTPGSWQPSLSVTVVIPAYDAARTLPYTLAALAAQTYPEELLDVVVVHDGGDDIALPTRRPARCRVVSTRRSWGRAAACATGADAATGDVIHWLDADMVPSSDEVERQLRWHHVIDHAVVVGHKTFVEADDLPPVDVVAQAVAEGRLPEVFADRWTGEHEWVERIWRRTGDLDRAGFRAFHVHVGSTASVRKDLYDVAGGMDPDLKLGEDIELGYRLTAKGAVFIADREASAWHLGHSMLMRHQAQVQRYNAPFIAERVPDFRKFRRSRGRMYRVPLVEVTVDARGATYEQVRDSVDGTLAGVPGDVACTVLGPWSQLQDERRHPLRDGLLDLRLVREEYLHDARVRLTEELAPSAFPAMYRLHLPTGWAPGEQTVEETLRDMQRRALGVRSALLPDGRVARFERTAAVERAFRLVTDGEDFDDVLDQISGTWWSDGLEDGFHHAELAPAPSPGDRDEGPLGTAGSQPDTDGRPMPEARRLRVAVARRGLGRLRRAVWTTRDTKRRSRRPGDSSQPANPRS